MTDLAKRAIACKGWRRMAGMLDTDGVRVCDVDWHVGAMDIGPAEVISAPPVWQVLMRPLALPDLTDPATLGCLLALVREAWGEPSTYAMHDRPENREPGLPWCINFGDGTLMAGVFRTEADALVTALEAAEREVSDE